MVDLVTGATGLLGSHLTEALQSQGRLVRALVRSSSDVLAMEATGIECVQGSLVDRESVRRAMESVDRVFHCAGRVSDWGSPEDFHASNVLGVEIMLEEAVRANVKRFVHVSSTDVYGYPDEPVDETAPLRRRGLLYGDSKIAGEEAVWNCWQRTHAPITVIRPATIFGPRCEPFVTELIERIRDGEVAIIGSGNKPAGLAFVSNVVDAMLLAAESKAAIGKAFNIHDGNAVTWPEHFEALASVAGLKAPTLKVPRWVAYRAGYLFEKAYQLLGREGPIPLTRTAIELLATDQSFSIDRACKELGYQPRVSYREGIRRTAQWLEEQSLQN